jgi:hypothetical protein
VSSTVVSRPADEQIHADACVATYAVLGLTPQADANLIEIAYWCQVELCHAAGLEWRDWRARLSELNEARAYLAGLATSRPALTPLPPPRVEPPAPRPTNRAVLAAVYAPTGVVAAATVGVAALGLWGATLIMALVSAVLFAVILAAGLLRRAPVSQPAIEVTSDEALRLLALAPAPPLPLVSLSHQYLSRRAQAEGDVLRRAVLDAAVALLVGGQDEPGAPEGDARTASDAGARSREGDAVRPPLPAPSDTGSDDTRAATDADASLQVVETPGRNGHARTELNGSAVVEVVAAPRRKAERAPARPSAETGAVPPDAGRDGEAQGEGDADQRVAVFLRIARDGSTRSRELPLIDGRAYAIGSSYSSSIRLAAQSVAAEHARLTIRRGRVLFHHIAPDAKSLVNGSETTWAVIEPGDLLEVGEYRCRFTSPLGADDDRSAVEAGAGREPERVSLAT